MLSVATPSSLRTIPLATRGRRLLVLVPVLFALTGCIFAVRWCAGTTLAQTAAEPELAQFAVRLAPGDPQTHFTLGKLSEASFSAADLNLAVSEYQQAARLAPDDYRLWSILAGARERAGDVTGAEFAYMRAEQLAPAYAMPRWAAGNFFLRQGRLGEGVEQLCSAADIMERLRGPVLDLLSQYSGGDTSTLLQAIGPRRELRRALVQFLIDRRQPSEALIVWSSLDSGEKQDAAPIGMTLMTVLAGAHLFAAAGDVSNDLVPAIKVSVGQIQNAGFEENVETDGTNIFGWRLAAGNQPQVALDGAQRSGGSRSLIMAFEVSDRQALRDVTQLVVVAPQTRYRLTYQTRAANLRGAPLVRVQILNAITGQVLSQSEAIKPEDSPWHQESLVFLTPPVGDGVYLRIGTIECPSEFCPLFGRFWYDDFDLRKDNAGIGPAR